MSARNAIIAVVAAAAVAGGAYYYFVGRSDEPAAAGPAARGPVVPAAPSAEDGAPLVDAFAVDDEDLHDADAVDEAIDESLEELIEGAEMIGEDGEPFVDVYGEPGDSFLTAPPPGADVYEEEIDPELEAVEPEQP